MPAGPSRHVLRYEHSHRNTENTKWESLLNNFTGCELETRNRSVTAISGKTVQIQSCGQSRCQTGLFHIEPPLLTIKSGFFRTSEQLFIYKPLHLGRTFTKHVPQSTAMRWPPPTPAADPCALTFCFTRCGQWACAACGTSTKCSQDVCRLCAKR